MASSGDIQISLRSISKSYGSLPVLRDLSLDIASGQFLAIVGRSGSGKSTLLKLIGGLDSADAGEIVHGGRPLSKMNERELSAFRRSSLGFVFQFFNLIPTLTVVENVRLPAELNGMRAKTAESRAVELLEELGVHDCSGRFPDEISGGEQQRAAIARALIHEPELVVADEPTGNLDIDTANAVVQHLTDSCRRRATTLIVATHSSEVASRAERVIGIRNGALTESTR